MRAALSCNLMSIILDRDKSPEWLELLDPIPSSRAEPYLRLRCRTAAAGVDPGVAAVPDATISRDLGVCEDTGHRPIKRWYSARIMARPPTTRRNASPLITLQRPRPHRGRPTDRFAVTRPAAPPQPHSRPQEP